MGSPTRGIKSKKIKPIGKVWSCANNSAVCWICKKKKKIFIVLTFQVLRVINLNVDHIYCNCTDAFTTLDSNNKTGLIVMIRFTVRTLDCVLCFTDIF